MSHTSGSLELLHVYDFPNLSAKMAADESGLFYSTSGRTYTSISERLYRLFAFDTNLGTYAWKSDSCTLEAGNRVITISGSNLYVMTSISAYACEAATGKNIWSLKLGEGHVGIALQLEPDIPILRVYYGETIFELDPGSGDIIHSRPMDNLLWKIGQVEIYQFPPGYMEARNNASGEKMWGGLKGIVGVGEYLVPISIDSRTLLAYIDQGLGRGLILCALDFKSGSYKWCDQSIYFSNVGVDLEAGRGYVIRSDFNLVEIDLQTGKALSETYFPPAQIPEDKGPAYRGYFVAVTDDTVIVYFGDSEQLFVMKR
jgi:outer membrane protein assembly factor BamB